MAGIGNFPHHGEHPSHDERMSKLAVSLVILFVAAFVAMFVLARV
jgi:hypothetical protein